LASSISTENPHAEEGKVCPVETRITVVRTGDLPLGIGAASQVGGVRAINPHGEFPANVTIPFGDPDQIGAKLRGTKSSGEAGT
jgi:hypothetical protein